jgi:hypothetical protein
MRETIELILTDHAVARLNDRGRFDLPPQVRLNDNVRLLHLRRVDNKEAVWMCQSDGGFLVGELKNTKRCQMLIVKTAISRTMYRKTAYIRIACHRLVIDKITLQSSDEWPNGFEL